MSTAASVFNPHILAELKQFRSSTIADSMTNNKFTPSFVAISTVRRNIFGPVDHEECRILVERELQKQQSNDADYWGFDFVREIPRGGRTRFRWEAIPDKPIARPQKRPCCEPIYDISHLYPDPIEVRPDIEENTPTKPIIDRPATVVHAAKKIKLSEPKHKQPLITEYMSKIKNGSHLTAKKGLASTPSPSRTGKIVRSLKSIRS